jgi:hypothetical protein
MNGIAGEKLHRRRHFNCVTSAVHLRMQVIHYSNVVTGFNKTITQRSPNESSATSYEHGR